MFGLLCFYVGRVDGKSDSTPHARKSTSDAKKSTSDAKKSTSDAKKFTSDVRITIDTKNFTSDAKKSTSDATKSTSDVRITIDTKISTSDVRTFNIDAKNSTSDAKKSTSDAKNSTSDAKKSTSHAKKSTSDAKKSTSDAEKSTSDPPTQLSQCKVPLPRARFKSSHQIDDKKDMETLINWVDSRNDPTIEIIKIICRRTNRERQQMKANYEEKNGRIWREDVELRFKGTLKDVITACMIQSEVLDAVTIHKALEKSSSDSKWPATIIVGIMCSRTSEEIRTVKKFYKTIFHMSFHKAIKNAAFGDDFKRMIKYTKRCPRDAFTKTHPRFQVIEDAKNLHKACTDGGIQKPNEEFLKEIFLTRSLTHLQSMLYHFEITFKKDIKSATNNLNFSADFKKAIATISYCAKNMTDWLAVRIYKSMHCGEHTALIYYVVSQSERDLSLVKECFQRRYHRTMEQVLEEEWKGLYMKALRTLIRNF